MQEWMGGVGTEATSWWTWWQSTCGAVALSWLTLANVGKRPEVVVGAVPQWTAAGVVRAVTVPCIRTMLA